MTKIITKDGASDAEVNAAGDVSTGQAEQTDGVYSPEFVGGADVGGGTGWAESGVWAAQYSSGLPTLERNSNNDTLEEYIIPLPLLAKTTALKGLKITSVKMAYTCNLADAGDDIQIHLIKRSMPANGAAPGAITTVVGDADGDYDAAHDTAAERVLDTGAPEDHTLTMTNDDQAYIADGETWALRIQVTEADDGTGGLSLIIKDINVYFSETIA